jgi:GYF domain 2
MCDARESCFLAPPMPSAAQDLVDWYVARERRQSGPYSREFIWDAARGGGLSRQDLLWRAGWGEWRDAGAVEGLFEESGTKSPQVRDASAAPEQPAAVAAALPPPPPAFAPPPVSAPPPAMSNAAHAQSGYFVRHWRGELSLAMAYWASGILANLLIRSTDGAFDFFAERNDFSPAPYAALSIAVALFGFVLTVWLFVGIWRSASCHKSRGGRIVWAWVAKTLVVGGVIATTALYALVTVPEISENVRTALGVDESNAHAFRLLGDGTELEFSGPITIGTAGDFARILDAAPQVKVLHLSSPGGLTGEADRIAQKVAKRGLITYVSDECSSACTDIFLAGRERFVGTRAKLGFHRASYGNSVSYRAYTLARQEREHLLSLGIPSDFAEKVVARVGNSIWFPTHDELLRAHVISGVAERGRFADTRTSADIEKTLVQVPIYASMKETAPKIFGDLVDSVAQESEGGATNGEILATAQEQLSELINRLLPRAPDRLVLEEASIFIGYLDRLKSIDPESCAAVADADGAELKIDLHRQFPDLGKRELALRETIIISTDPDRPVPSASAVEADLKRVFDKMQKQFGADADLLDKDGLKPTEYKRYCEVMAAFYREVTRLPATRAADVLRHLYSER